LKNQKTATEVGSFINFRSRTIKIIYYLHHSCRVIENPTTITRNICFFEFRDPKIIDIALKKEHSHLETSVREEELAAQIKRGLIGFL
jgi:hypothetical protein